MRLATSPSDDVQTFLAEDDPLPPEDRASDAVPATLDALYRSQFVRLFRFFSRKAGKDEAHDLVQEAFVRFAGRKIKACDSIAKPEAYLTTVATNLLRDRARAAARRTSSFRASPVDGVLTLADPHKLLEDRQALARLDEAIGRLGARRRKIFLLHRLENLTYEEIADETGMSIKGVKKQMAKALFELRRDVGPL